MCLVDDVTLAGGREDGKEVSGGIDGGGGLMQLRVDNQVVKFDQDKSNALRFKGGCMKCSVSLFWGKGEKEGRCRNEDGER
jgi:hypothetical protein